MIKAIIFDCFGVFIGNPYKIRAEDLERKSPEIYIELSDINHASDRGYISNQESVTRMSEIFGITPEQFLSEQKNGEVQNLELIDYAKNLRPEYKLGMLSNVSSRERLDMRFAPGQLDELFDVVVASGEEGVIKPEPRIFEIVCERLGMLPEECVFIDDILENCEAAESLGMNAIQYISVHQCVTDLEALIDRGEKTD
jgi:putative hydrolase of the HAD superfamily